MTRREKELLALVFQHTLRVESEPDLPYQGDARARVAQMTEKEFGPLCARLFARVTESQRQILRRAADRLAVAGLVALERGEDGAYVRHISLTAAGRKVVEGMMGSADVASQAQQRGQRA